MKNKDQFKVIPNLSLRASDIQSRLRNRSLILEGNGQYSLEESIDEVRRMGKADKILKTRELQESVNNLRAKLNG